MKNRDSKNSPDASQFGTIAALEAMTPAAEAARKFTALTGFDANVTILGTVHTVQVANICIISRPAGGVDIIDADRGMSVAHSFDSALTAIADRLLPQLPDFTPTAEDLEWFEELDYQRRKNAYEIERAENCVSTQWGYEV